MASTSTAVEAARGGRAGPGWLRAGAALVAAGFATPFIYLLVENLTADGGALTFLTKQAWAPLMRSVVLATAVAIASTCVGVAAAWLVTRTDVPARKLWRVLLPLPLVIPSFIGAFVLIAAFAPGGFLDSILEPLGFEGTPTIRGGVGSFLVLTLFTYPYVYLLVAARMRQLPSSLEESARLLGAGAWRTFFSIVLPQARASVLAGGLLVFLYSISDFGVVQLMRFDALTRAIYSTRVFDRPTSLALSLQLGLLALAVVILERTTTTGPRQVKSARVSSPLELKLGRARWLGAALLAIIVGLALIVPVAVLAYWALRGIMSGSTSGFLVPGSIGGPLLNTTFVSVTAAAIAVIVVLPVAYLTVRYRSRVGDATNAVVVAGFALPGLAIALSLVYLTVSSDLLSGIYQTLTLLLVAYVVHFGAQAMRGHK